MYKFNEILNYKLAFTLKTNSKLFTDVLKDANITSLNYGALVLINQNPNITQIELAHLLNVDRTTCSKIVEKLTELNYIAKTKSEKDKRAYTLEITDNGLEIIKKYWESRKNSENFVLKSLTNTERETFNRLLDKIVLDNKKES